MRALFALLAVTMAASAGAFAPGTVFSSLRGLRQGAACRVGAASAGAALRKTGLARSPGQKGPCMQLGGAARKGARLVKFRAGDMEILRPIGEMGFATVTDWEYFGESPRNPMDPSTPSRTVESSGASIRLFEARVARGSLKGARMLLKEYLPSARALASQELSIYQDLVEDWGGRTNDDFAEAPVATLRGWFETTVEVSSPAFQSDWAQRFPRSDPPSPGNIWLVFRYDGNDGLPRLWRERTKEASFWDKLSAPAIKQGGVEERYLRQLMKSSIAALAFLHDRQVLHRSIGGPSVLVSSLRADDSASLQVKIGDFGFASKASQLDDSSVYKAREAGAKTPSETFAFLAAEDVYALGYVLMETIFTVLSRDKRSAGGGGDKPQGLMKAWLQQTGEGGGGGQAGQQGGAGGATKTDQGALKRLVEDIYGFDVTGGFRDYCEGTAEWADAVAFLDAEERAGWELLEAMLNEPKRTKRRRTSSYSEGDDAAPEGEGGGGGATSLTEMSDEEFAAIEIPSSFSAKAAEGAGMAPVVMSARGLLNSRVFEGLQMPWWLPGEEMEIFEPGGGGI